MIHTKEEYVAWAAGIFEGEGNSDKNHPIQISQKDTWILYKLQELFGGNIYTYERKEGGNNISRWCLMGEHGRDLLKLFIPYLSPRRIQQIENNGSLSILMRKNTCQKGHEFTPYNTRWLSNGTRTCRICQKMKNRKRGGYVAA